MNKKILVVDDNKLNLLLISQILEDEDYQVVTLENGKDIFDKCKTIKPDAILLDIMMPEIDGFEVCKLLKEYPETTDIPIIMVTAKTDGEDLREAFQLGAFDYIKKPIDELEVIARLNSALKFSDQQKQLATMAMKDGLTDLYNHKLIKELFEREYSKAVREDHSIAFLMIDIDHFKNVNDTYGHTAGDKVIREVAEILHKNARLSDIVGRYGGEEFCMILPGVSDDSVQTICERIRETVEKHTFEVSDDSIHITISIGVCYKSPAHSSSYEEMIIQADKALYQAKNSGRNRIVNTFVE